MTKNIEKATINILVELDGDLYMVKMKKDDFEAVSFLTKRAIDTLVKTERKQVELLEFLGLSQ